MRWVWKLLRRHISVAQLTGFFLANLCGMVIVLLGIQFYSDVLPVLTGGDSFMKKDYLIVSRKVSTLGSVMGGSKTFSEADREEIASQPFTVGVGEFTPSQFKVSAGVHLEQAGLKMSTVLFFESVPDEYIDVRLERWRFSPEEEVIPIILPRNYLNLYNFGFAQSRGMPQLSEGVMGMVNLDIRVGGNGRSDTFKGRIVGFSNRLNTILVPRSFMDWANTVYADGAVRQPSRLIVEVDNPADERIARFFREKGYETEGDKLDAGKTAWFLRLAVGAVLGVGLVISLLSFYLLMLSIYLLLQKNTVKLENLLLIGYSPRLVALPYQLLTAGLNLLVLILSLGVVFAVRPLYLGTLARFVPDASEDGVWMTLSAGVVLWAAVSVCNVLAVRRRVDGIAEK